MSYTRAQVRDLIKQRCNMENTSAQVDTEINTHINDATSYVHDFLISTWGERYSRKSGTASISANTNSASISATNFYRPIRIGITFDGINYPLASYSDMDAVINTVPRSWGPAELPRYSLMVGEDGTVAATFDSFTDSAKTLTLLYHPTAPTYSTDSDQILVPHVDLLVMEACIRVKDKDEREATRFMQERQLIQKRIEDWDGSADAGNVDGTLRVGRFGKRSAILPDGRLF